MIKKIKTAVKSWKIRTKLSILMLAAAIASLSLFWGIWSNMGNVWKFLCRFPSITWDENALIEELEANAKYYDVPDREENKEAQAEFKSFFAPKDEYTGIYAVSYTHLSSLQMRLQGTKEARGMMCSSRQVQMNTVRKSS